MTPTDPGFHDYVMEQLRALEPVQSRAMFGGYGVYLGRAMFGLISSQARLYFKVDDSNRAAYTERSAERFHRMPYFEVPVDVLEDQESLREWMRAAITVGLATARER